MEELPIPTDEYSVRYCAFVDILGFTGVIADLKRGIINHRQLRDILARVHRPSIPPFMERSGDLRTQSISDAVCIYVHILRLLELFRRGTPDAIGVVEMYADFAKPLQARFDASVDEPRHFEKQQWFARYWNEVVERFDGRVPIITGPGF